ncbi:MAG: hypothetical protein WCJ40_09550 [Planctomycetota bacterium]|nr:MAG: hypothetical protein DWH73_03660 [Planctomycetota bacterium]
MNHQHLPVLDWSALKYESLAGRPSKVDMAQMGQLARPGASFADFLATLPNQLGGKNLRALITTLAKAHKEGHRILAAAGGHVIKTGCGPYLADWIRKGILQGLALNGAASIHDLELALVGHTSEDVGPRLHNGTFGFAHETSELFAQACSEARSRNEGLGQCLARIAAENAGSAGRNVSVLVAAHETGMPLTIHVAVGTDITHMTPKLDGADLGAATLTDFRRLCQSVAGLQNGVWLNLGSAVVMPEVFLKAVAIAHNLGYELNGMTTANLDFQQQYRGLVNVLQRPGSQGIGLTGHHEILIPLLHLAVIEEIARISG